uniref:Enhancer of mRNA-decapping protein 3 n=1 Tax=Nothobranchius furzeri TaxID=105023 RepID=A0A8C6PVR1_NOTFU
MAADWLGSVVSINCGATLGVYQGEVSSVDRTGQTISLKQPYHNGVRCPVPEVTFSAMDIKELKFLDIHNRAPSKAGSGEGNPAEPSSVSGGQQVQSNRTTQTHAANSRFPSSSAPISIPHRGASNSRGMAERRNGVRTRGPVRSKDDECFGDGTNENLDTDFDFEGNLALFDKAAVFSQIDGISDHRDQHHSTQVEQKAQSYRHDENILQAKPVIYRQITVPQSGGKEYCTDSGLVVPSIPYRLHKRLLEAAERWGLSPERRLETIGVCSSQMALSLLGGPNRLTPKNAHQRPSVVLLCGPHIQGAQGISCGRHLANHEVEVILLLPSFARMEEVLTREVCLYGRTSGLQVADVRGETCRVLGGSAPVSVTDTNLNSESGVSVQVLFCCRQLLPSSGVKLFYTSPYKPEHETASIRCVTGSKMTLIQPHAFTTNSNMSFIYSTIKTQVHLAASRGFKSNQTLLIQHFSCIGCNIKCLTD